MNLTAKKEMIADKMYHQTTAGAKGASPKYTQRGRGGQGIKAKYTQTTRGSNRTSPPYRQVGKGGQGSKPAYVQTGQSQDFGAKYRQANAGKNQPMLQDTRKKMSQMGRGSLERAAGGRNLGEKMTLGKNEATRP